MGVGDDGATSLCWGGGGGGGGGHAPNMFLWVSGMKGLLHEGY